MRRRVAAACAAVMSVASVPSAWGTHESKCIELRVGGTRCHAIEHPELDPPGPASPARVGAGRVSPPAARDVLYRPMLVLGPEEWCITWRREAFADAANSGRAAEAERRWLMLARSYRLCQGAVRPPGVRPAPSVVAREVVEEIALPAPAPSIAPGFAITGKPAYLETGGDLRPPPFERPTELGLITVTARGTYVVDWGDGSPRERHTVEGGPWPQGTIRHTYTDIGRYEVVVAVEWTADWVVAGVPGTIEGLRTSATVAGFEVRQIQAVRDF